MIKYIKIFSKFLTRKLKLRLICLLFLMIISSASEALSIASLIPFLNVALNPKQELQNSLLFRVFSYFSINPSQTLFSFGLIFLIAIIFSCLFRLLTIKFLYKTTASFSFILSSKSYEKLIRRSFIEIQYSDSSKSINALSNHIPKVVNQFRAILQIITAVFISLSIMTTLIIIDIKIAFITISIYVLIYSILAKSVRKKLINNSKKISNFLEKEIRITQESLGLIRDIKINNTTKRYIDIFKNNELPLREKEAESQFLAIYPRYLLECIGIGLIILFSFTFETNTTKTVTLMGTYALAAQRLLPVMQIIYGSWSILKSSTESLKIITDLLNNKEFKNKKNNFLLKKRWDSITFDNVHFSYPNSKNKILNNISFKIKRGEKVGIIGKTGSGKSTLLDLLSGLISPEKGRIYTNYFDENSSKYISVNNDESPIKIAYIPQKVFLANKTIMENIGFIDDHLNIKFEKIKECSKIAQLSEFIKTLPEGYNTLVGENGVKLSGGQIQRIGIARALYSNPEIIIFDESTSALDTKTEDNLISSIEKNSKDKTFIIVSHRERSIKSCDKILLLNNKTINYQK